MSKHLRKWNESKYRRYLNEGRGQGSLSSYKPWIMVQDFPSKGMVSRVHGTKTKRIHHLLSNNELYYFYLLDWSEKVVDIKEQFPLLDLERTMRIAEESGIHYPYDNISGFPYVLTSDFMITTTTEKMVRTVKMVSELKKRRVIEKLEIERRYWQEQNVDWKIVTERELSRQKAYNIEWLAQAKDLSFFPINECISDTLIKHFLMYYAEYDMTYQNIIDKIENDFDLCKGIGFCIFKHLAYWKKIVIDIESDQILKELTKTRDSQTIRCVI